MIRSPQALGDSGMDKVENQGDHGITESIHRLDEGSEFKFL